MTLGERIRALRMRQSLSQEALAEKLEVSRQSVSKWETDGAIPDLDKLVKLSEVFAVTLDELVRGGEPRQAPPPVPPTETRRIPTRVIVGIVLLVMAFLSFWGGVLLEGALLFGILLAAPFAACGAVCLLVKWHPGLVCAWLLTVAGDYFMAVGMRFGWRIVLRSVTRLGFAYFKAGWNYFDFAMLLLQLGWIVFLIFRTVCSLRPHIPPLNRKLQTLVAGGWLLFVLLHANWLWWTALWSPLVDWLRFALLAVLLGTVSRASAAPQNGIARMNGE